MKTDFAKYYTINSGLKEDKIREEVGLLDHTFRNSVGHSTTNRNGINLKHITYT